jgi:hypothetical protein
VQTLQVDEQELATKPFAMVGARWDAGTLSDGAQVQVRTRTAEVWSDWQNLEPADIGPDAGSADDIAAERRGDFESAEPLWVGNADGVQTRTIGGVAPAHLTLTLIDPGSSRADATPGSSVATSGSAFAERAQGRILPRSAWGADESIRTGSCKTPTYNATIKVGFVHHTAHGATANDYSADDVPKLLRAIYANDVLNRGWCDIAYNFVIDKFGRIWEGRAGGIDRPVQGAHTAGFNRDSFGVALLGNFETETSNGVEPPRVMLDSLNDVFAWKLALHKRDPLGVDTLVSSGTGGTNTQHPAGKVVWFHVISGHRDAGSTDCPGSTVYRQLSAMRNAVAKLIAEEYEPVGALETVWAAPGGAQLRGWAVDQDTKDPLSVHVYVNGQLKMGVTANAARADVAAKYPALGPNHGFSFIVPLAPGATYEVCAFALNVGPGSKNPKLGCGTVTPISGDPIGTGEIRAIPGGIAVKGWAFDPDTADPTTIQVLVNGRVQVGFTANRTSVPEVGERYPFFGANRGFDIGVPLATGRYSVCVQALNVGPGAHKQLACETVQTYAGTPMGRVDGVQAVPGGARLWGWAFDPDSSAPIPVHVYVDGKLVAGVTAGEGRPDVGAAYPVYGPFHGYSMTLPMAAGTHTVCVWALNIAGSGGNPQLGCGTVKVMAGNPFGTLDGVEKASGGARLWGWAIDPDTTAAIPVHVYVDGKLAAIKTADEGRADVAAVYPVYGPMHGYSMTLPMGPGPHTVCAFGINVAGSGTNPQLGCRQLTL